MDPLTERRRSVDHQIEGIKNLITQRFDGMDSRVDELTTQVKLTNGRLQTAERNIAVLQDRVYVSAGALVVAAVAYAVSLFR